MKTIVNYAEKVKEQHALNKTLAPVETDLTDASRAYAIGEQFIYDGDLFKAKTAIAQHDALVYNTNYEDADDITTQIKNKTVTTDPVPTEGSTNPVQSNGVYVENRNIYEVMGKMGAKALLPMSLADIKAKNTTGTWNNNAYTINGVTFTVNTDSDGFITDIAATGTASADATLMVYGYSYTSAYAVTFDAPVIASIDFVGSDSTARGIVWGTNSAYIEATEVQIPAGTIYGFGLRVLNGYEIPVGGITFKPMVRFASDNDDTYQPYVKTNKELTAENQTLTNNVGVLAENGAINRLPNNVTTQIINGVTFTINANDKTITANGTSTDVCILPVDSSTRTLALDGDYRLSGCPSGGSSTTYMLRISPATGAFVYDYGNGATTTLSSDNLIKVEIRISSGVTLNNLVFKPMIADADYTGGYVPYAMTNKELTGSIVNSYVFKGVDSITVTAEAADTWATMIERSRVAINNYLANLGDNEYVRFIGLTGSYAGMSQTYDLKKKNDSFSGIFLSNGYTNSYATAVTMLIRIATTNITAIQTTFSTSTGESSTRSMLSDSFTSGLTMTYLIDKFIKIQ